MKLKAAEFQYDNVGLLNGCKIRQQTAADISSQPDLSWVIHVRLEQVVNELAGRRLSIAACHCDGQGRVVLNKNLNLACDQFALAATAFDVFIAGAYCRIDDNNFTVVECVVRMAAQKPCGINVPVMELLNRISQLCRGSQISDNDLRFLAQFM